MAALRCGPRNLAGKALAIVLAGGRGSRLGVLTRRQAKPALSFGGRYRNIDFTLSNCVNSGIERIAVLTQYRAGSLHRYLRQSWSELPGGGCVEVWPAQQRRRTGGYAGTADAVWRNLRRIDALAPDHVVILAGDHVYKMDYRSMLDAHATSGASATVGCIAVPLREASSFGVIDVDGSGRIRRFDEKPRTPAPLPGRADRALASMGIYVFNRQVLAERLRRDAADAASRHDFGRNLLPALIEDAHVLAYPFQNRPDGGPGYWRDVGTPDSYWQANLELLDDAPQLDLEDPAWPVRARLPDYAPPRFTGTGSARHSIVSGGCVVGGRVGRSLLSPNCRIGEGSHIDECVLLPHARIGRDCRIRRAIIAGGSVIPDGTVIGEDDRRDAEWYDVSENRVTVVSADGLTRRHAAAGEAWKSRDPRAAPRPRTAAQPDVVANWGAH